MILTYILELSGDLEEHSKKESLADHHILRLLQTVNLLEADSFFFLDIIMDIALRTGEILKR